MQQVSAMVTLKAIEKILDKALAETDLKYAMIHVDNGKTLLSELIQENEPKEAQILAAITGVDVEAEEAKQDVLGD